MNSPDEIMITKEDQQKILDYAQRVSSRLQSIRGQKFIVPHPGPREHLLGQHNARRLADNLQSQHPTIKRPGDAVSFVFNRSPPSSKALAELNKIYIEELKWGTTHNGSVLVVANLTVPRDFSKSPEDGYYNDSLLTVVEDEHGQAHNLRLYNQLASAADIQSLFPVGIVFAIKEPYCEGISESVNGIRVDQPADICFLAPGHPLFPAKWTRNIPEHPEKTSECLKNQGNAAFKEKQYRIAIERYTEALHHEPDPSLQSTLLLNRSQAYIFLGDFSKAYEDAVKVATDQVSNPNAKALFRASRALYEMRLFPKSAKFLQQLSDSFLDNKDALIQMSRMKQRIAETDQAKFEWTSIIGAARLPFPRLDVADFTGNVTRESSRTFHAKRDLRAGELVLALKASAVAYPAEMTFENRFAVFDVSRSLLGEPVGQRLTKLLVHKCLNDSNAYKDIMILARDLTVYEDGHYAETTTVDHQPIVDVNVIDAIRETYSQPFLPLHPLVSNSGSHTEGVGLWPSATRLTVPHSCLPNAMRSFVGDLLILRAARDIKKGEVITTSYVPPIMPVEERHSELSRSGLGLCECLFCQIEGDEGQIKREERYQLLQRIKALSERAPAEALRTDSGRDDQTRPSEDVVREVAKNVKDICDELEKTYTRTTREQPRFALLEPLAYLFACYLYLGTDRTSDALLVNFEYLDALGFEYECEDKGGRGGDILLKRHGFYHPFVVKTLVQQSSVCWQLGRQRMANSWRRMAEDAMEIITGSRKLFGETYAQVYASLGWTL